MKKILVLLFVGLFTFSIKAQDNVVDGWGIKGTSQIIPYFDGRDFNNDTYAPGHTTMKTEIGINKSFGDNVDFKVAFQDWRVFGMNNTLTNDMGSLHLKEGWIRFNDIFGSPISLKAGRFQLGYGSERFIGKSFWNYQERKFDGFVFNYTGDNTFIDFFLTNHSSAIQSQVFNTMPDISPISEYSNYNIYGLWYNNTVFDGQSFDIFAYLDENAATNANGDPALNRYTVGFDYFGDFGVFKPSVEFGYQLGEASGKDIAAYLASISADFDLNAGGIKVGLDMHSGSEDGNAEEINTYDNYLGSKHKFFGLMDYFVRSRGAYNGVGVNDIYAGASYKMGNYKFSLMGHYFMSNAENENILLDGDPAGTAFGSEIDLILRYNIKKGIFVEAGQGVFLPGDLMKAVYNGNEDMSFVSYLRAVVKL